jgi:hypothetical protein
MVLENGRKMILVKRILSQVKELGQLCSGVLWKEELVIDDLDI